jgi:hypothetical protein
VSNIFDLTAERFSRATALSLSQLSALAYEDPDVIRKVIEDGGMKLAWFENEETDTQAFVAWDDEVSVLVFRGTAEAKDWLTDLNADKVPYGSHSAAVLPFIATTYVHEGFWKAWCSVRDEILDYFVRIYAQERKILVTGHSLGGALALIAAHQLSIEMRHRGSVRLYTFGQPRVLNESGVGEANLLLLGYHRFVHNNDVVARVPAWGFAHGGRLNHFDHTGRLYLDPFAWIVWCDRILGRIRSRRLNPFKWTTDGIDDHSMDRYVELVRAWAEPSDS